MKIPFISYADLECLLEKMSTCHNNPEKSSATKINGYTPSVYSLLMHCSFDATENKLDCYRGKDCIERFLQGFKRVCNKNNFEKKK